MADVTELRVEGYRSIRGLRLPLGRVNVIVGPNGVGKTNLYRSMVLLAAAASCRFSADLAAEGGMPSVLWAGARKKGVVRMRLAVTVPPLAYELIAGLTPPARLPRARPSRSIPRSRRSASGRATPPGARRWWSGATCRPSCATRPATARPFRCSSRRTNRSSRSSPSRTAIPSCRWCGSTSSPGASITRFAPTHSAALAEALAQATGAIPLRLEKIEGETRVAGMRASGELGED